jgi:hypothetical protein
MDADRPGRVLFKQVGPVVVQLLHFDGREPLAQGAWNGILDTGMEDAHVSTSQRPAVGPVPDRRSFELDLKTAKREPEVRPRLGQGRRRHSIQYGFDDGEAVFRHAWEASCPSARILALARPLAGGAQNEEKPCEPVKRKAEEDRGGHYPPSSVGNSKFSSNGSRRSYRDANSPLIRAQFKSFQKLVSNTCI